jgi:hypothetical protein
MLLRRRGAPEGEMPYWLQESIGGVGLLLAMASVLFLTFADPENPANTASNVAQDNGAVVMASALPE